MEKFLFLHFPDLLNLIIYAESTFSYYSLLDMKVIWIYYLPLIKPCTLMSGCLYLPKNLKDIKGHINNYITSCKTFFQRRNSFEFSKQPLSFYCSVLFATEAVFIIEEVTKRIFGTLFEVREKFSSSLNVFSFLIVQWLLNILESFIAIKSDFEKHQGNVFLL